MFPAVMRGNQVNNQNTKAFYNFEEDVISQIHVEKLYPILDIFGPNLGSKWEPQFAEKYQKMLFLWAFRVFLDMVNLIVDF